MKIDLSELTIEKVQKHFKKGDFTVTELVEAYLSEIEKKNDELNIYLSVYGDVRDKAKEADGRYKEKTARSLEGIPFAVKDNILVKGQPASAGSKILEGYVATYDATAIEKLKEAGAIFLGRTNCDEFAMGASTENSAFGPTRNPHDPTRVPGGSSGGSTAAVAANMALVALGSDTGGSVRQPSALCGTVGFKPTYGAVSRYGLIALASSFDCIGPIAKNVSDTELVFGVIKGEDSMDSTSISDDTYPKEEIKGKPVVGLPSFVFDTPGMNDDAAENFKAASKKIIDMGYEVKEVDLPYVKYSVPTYYVILPAEASANLARFDGVKYGLRKEGADLLETYMETRGEGFGPEPRRRILIGAYVLSAGYHDAYYNKAQAVRQKIREDFGRAFEEVDVIMTPTTAGPAFKIGEKVDDPIQMYLQDVFTAPANLAGLPAISVPSGVVAEGGIELPLGLQFIASHSREDLLFEIAKDFRGE
jgi:aspartyl-tRNA(Asn)/glutamyl-tRNA(Gln) amidotransferase subunit A